MAKKRFKNYRVGLNSHTLAISLVEDAAIQEEFVALSEEEKVFLAQDERHVVYGAVLVPSRPIYRNNQQLGEHYITFEKEAIEAMAYEFMSEARTNEITLDHATKGEDISVVELWIKESLTQDKSVAVGLNPSLPIGTLFCGMKVNNEDTWKRIKDGSLRGFSVESLVSLEEFNNQIKEDSMIDEMSLISKIKDAFKEVLSSVSMQKQEEVIEPIEPEALEAQEPTVETPAEPTVETPSEPIETPSEPQTVVEPTTVKEEPIEAPTEPQNEPQPKADDNTKHLEDLINSLKDEIKALKDMNSGLSDKVKALEKQPSAEPVNVNAKGGGNGGDNYSNWRSQMASLIGGVR